LEKGEDLKRDVIFPNPCNPTARNVRESCIKASISSLTGCMRYSTVRTAGLEKKFRYSEGNKYSNKSIARTILESKKISSIISCFFYKLI